jgi:hypothetical protein
VALGSALAVVLSHRTGEVGDLLLQQLAHDPQADGDREGHEALPRLPDQLAERLGDSRRERLLRRLLRGGDLGCGYGSHGGSSCPRWTCSHSPRFQSERTRREDRRLKFYELRDNLHFGQTDGVSAQCGEYHFVSKAALGREWLILSPLLLPRGSEAETTTFPLELARAPSDLAAQSSQPAT